jgi:hypothetical protein
VTKSGKIKTFLTRLEMANATFRCNGCGDTHRLTNEEQELYSEGYSSPEEYFCEHCQMESAHMHYDEFSDADPGL